MPNHALKTILDFDTGAMSTGYLAGGNLVIEEVLLCCPTKNLELCCDAFVGIYWQHSTPKLTT